MEESKFQFKGFLIKRSLIELKKGVPSPKLSISFNPKGVIKSSESIFQLTLGVKIEDENKTLLIEIIAVSDYIFDSEIDKETLNKLFYINAPALLFPYIRAYISTLTVLSGIKPITLPTLNLSALGNELKNNTVVEGQVEQTDFGHQNDITKE